MFQPFMSFMRPAMLPYTLTTCPRFSRLQSLPAASPLFMFMFMAQAGPMNFYSMDENSRKTYLDDGLHMTEYGYDALAGHISGLIQPSSQVTRKH
jgi:lysophospholipase L1-like esterase